MISRSVAVLAVAALVVSACSGDDAPDATAPLPGGPSTSAVPADGTVATTVPGTDTTVAGSTVVPESTSVPDSVVPDSSVPGSTSVPDSVVSGSSVPGSVPSSSVPGRFLVDVPGVFGGVLPAEAAAQIDVPGEVYELIPGLFMFIPLEDSTTDPNIEPPRPEDREILEAWARAQAAEYSLIIQNPIPGTVPDVEWDASRTPVWSEVYAGLIQESIDAGEHLEMREGDVLRPWVIREFSDSNTAFVADCQLGLSDWVFDATGELVAGEPEGLEIAPKIVELVSIGGEWLVTHVSGDSRGCS